MDPLLFNEVALEQPIVKLDLCKSLQIIVPRILELCQDAFQKVSHQVMMVDKDL